MEEAPAIGIDLGTTNSCVGVFLNGKVEIIPNDQGNRITPSYVAFTGNERLIGDLAKDQATRHLSNTIYDAKRLIGRKFTDDVVQNDMKQWPFKVINDDTKPKIEVEVEGTTKTFFPEETSSMILRRLKESAEAYLGKPVTKAVITVPANFNDAQRQATKDAATIAGLIVLRIINEPTAAAIAYGLEEKVSDKRNVLIFDLGGGTCDVSILTLNNGIFEVKSTAGDTHLGGENFDSRLVNHFVEEFNFINGTDITRNKKAMRRLMSASERAKRTLSSINKADIDIDCLHDGQDFYRHISRNKFEKLNADLFEKTMDLVEKAIRDADMDKTLIQDIVLVGGSSRIPKIQTLLQEFFEGKELHKSIDPDEAVAYGAAIQAAILNGSEAEAVRDILLLDVTPLSLGVGTKHNFQKMSVIIKRNTPIPVRKTELFTTHYDYQTWVKLPVYEGEFDETKYNNLLGEFTLLGIPPEPVRVPKVDVTFEVDANGILKVSAVERSSGKENHITIAYNQNRLSEDQIERMIKEAEEYKAKEETRKTVISSRESLESNCINVRNTIENDNLTDNMKKSDKKFILEKCDETIRWLKSDQSFDKEELEAKGKELEDIFILTSALASNSDDKKEKYFELLHISEGASALEIENAFRKVALKYHPDKCLGNKDIGQLMFFTLSNAKNFLLNEVKRRKQ